MDAIAAFAAALTVTAAGAAVVHYAVRAGASAVREQIAPDTEEWKRSHNRRRDTFAEFAAPAEQIGHILETWPALSPLARQPQRKAAYGHLKTLERRQGLILLEGGPDVRAAAQQLLDECTRLVRRLDPYAPPGPIDATPRGLAMPFLRACREYLEAESERHFGLQVRRRLTALR
ncbi:hypothetical protein ACWDWT_21495 [Streptomyces sp. NPDC003343]|uniref:Secreted protein n=1 Tax=Streptomyces lannensis TaxID=766498 RepID=A0ABP7KUD0_9ACTN